MRMAQVIEAGAIRRTFSLAIKGVDFSIGGALMALITDKDGTILIVNGLTNEQVLADGLVEVAAGILKPDSKK